MVDLVRDIPPEIWVEILSHVRDSAAIRSLIVASFRFSSFLKEALREIEGEEALTVEMISLFPRVEACSAPLIAPFSSLISFPSLSQVRLKLDSLGNIGSLEDWWISRLSSPIVSITLEAGDEIISARRWGNQASLSLITPNDKLPLLPFVGKVLGSVDSLSLVISFGEVSETNCLLRELRKLPTEKIHDLRVAVDVPWVKTESSRYHYPPLSADIVAQVFSWIVYFGKGSMRSMGIYAPKIPIYSQARFMCKVLDAARMDAEDIGRPLCLCRFSLSTPILPRSVPNLLRISTQPFSVTLCSTPADPVLYDATERLRSRSINYVVVPP